MRAANNAINTDSEKWRDEGAPLFAAGYGERPTWRRWLDLEL